MKNNKILENRPELTNEQIVEGMDFNKIKNAAIEKPAILKALVLKGLLGIIIICAGVFIYKNSKPSIPEKRQVALVDTTKMISPTEKDTLAIHTDIAIDKMPTTIIEHKTISNSSTPITMFQMDTSTINATANAGIQPEGNIIEKNASADDTETKNNERIEHGVKTKSNYKLNRYTKCKLWKPKSFCDIPKKAKLSGSYDVDAAEYDYVSCQEATKNMTSMKAVWVTIDINGRTRLQLESQLENIELFESKNGKMIHPLMIAAVADGSTFFGKNFKAKKFVANYDGQLDIFLFFSEAEVGDTIIIKNFVEAVIQE
jgi:hypothetical protein